MNKGVFMKAKDIANQYGLKKEGFESFLRQSNYKVNISLMGMSLDDDADIISIVSEYKKYEIRLSEERAIRERSEREAEERKRIAKQAEENRIRQAALDKKAALANMLITSGFTFDGYTVIKYSGYISGDDAISVDRGFSIFGGAGNVKDKLMEALVHIRRNALVELKEAAYALGCNAVIGVDYDYITLDPQTANLSGGTVYQPYVFGVTANGNAVVIEKNK